MNWKEKCWEVVGEYSKDKNNELEIVIDDQEDIDKLFKFGKELNNIWGLYFRGHASSN